MDLKGKIIHVIGDSITAGSGTSDPMYTYHAVLGRAVEAAAVNNYGIGGTRIARYFCPGENWGPAFVDRYEDMSDTADLVLTFGGTNDYGQGVPLGEIGDRTPETYCGACHLLFSGLIEKYPQARIAVILPMQRAGCTQPHPETGHTLLEYVDRQKTIAGLYSLPTLDLYREVGICVDLPVQRECFCPDGVHPNDAGAARIAARLEAFLRAI